MNSILNNEVNLPEFNYLNDQETTGSFDSYSRIGEFDPLSDPVFEPWLPPMQYDNIPELSLADIEEITRSLDEDVDLSSFYQGKNTLTGAIPTVVATQPDHQVSYEQQNTFVDATMKTTHDQSWYREQNTVTDAMPVYATITHHERQHFQTHYGRSVYDMSTDQSQCIFDQCIGGSADHENMVLNSMNIKDDYSDFSLHMENVLDVAEPISMMIPGTNHVQLCLNVSATNDLGDVKNTMNLKSEQSSNINAIVKYDDEVVLRQQVRPKTSALELDEIRQYFDLPITKAARELKVGLTVLKKRCRELRIMRWPHRKIKSLQCLIDNVKEMGMSSKKEIEMLEEHKRMLERVPELELSESTKRLRQSCFKANYKKRRLLLSSVAAAAAAHH
ncbi:hypothetical protein AgCh_036921 [Apium graveolens]